MHVLVLTADPLLVSALTDVCGEFGIEVLPTHDSQRASEQLNRARYEGIVLDFDTVPDAREFIDIARATRSNKNSIVFAIATDLSHMEQALRDRAHFLLRRPIGVTIIRKTICTAYDLMSGKRRRDFRCAANLPVRLTNVRSGVNIECSTMNVSSNGMAVSTPTAQKIAEVMDIALPLPDGFTVCATGIVIWDDQQGKSGLSFQCSDPEMRHKLDCWLDSQYAMAPGRAAVLNHPNLGDHNREHPGPSPISHQQVSRLRGSFHDPLRSK
jgi:CheY-like chemotaxis protein